jgi:hypothetical protein
MLPLAGMVQAVHGVLKSLTDQTAISIHLVGVPASPIPISVVSASHDNGWSIAASVATIGLCLIAAVALYVAAKQLGTIKDERTVKLIEEASSTMEELLGFFDFAADVRVSREAFSNLYKRLIRARPVDLRLDPTDDVAAASQTVLALIENDLDEVDSGPPDTIRERELRERVVAVTNFLERVSTLIEQKVINGKLFLQNQDYNIVASYYVLEPILQDLQRHEGFDFNDTRKLAVEAQPYLTWLRKDHILRQVTFLELTADGKSLRV